LGQTDVEHRVGDEIADLIGLVFDGEFGQPRFSPSAGKDLALRFTTVRRKARICRTLGRLANVRQERARLVVVELGAGTALPTVREFSEEVAREFGGTLIRVNPREAEVPAGHFGLALGALEGLRQLDAAAAPH
jgi:hypothetical protein